MTTTHAIDPICKMKVNPDTAAGSFEHEGTTYYFCNLRCRDKFSAEPNKYLAPGVHNPAPQPAPAIIPVVLESKPAKAEGSCCSHKEKFEDWRLDDNGNKFLVEKHETR